MLGTLDKFEDIMNFVAHRNLLGNLNDCIFKAEVARVDDAVSLAMWRMMRSVTLTCFSTTALTPW